MSSRVRVLNVSHVLPAAGADEAASGGSPQRQPLPDDRLLKLSFMDCLFVGVVPMQRLFFYEGPGVPPFPCVVQSLRSSLAAALGAFLPLAGKLDYRPSAAGGLVVDCSPAAVSPGVRFVEAQYDGSIGDMRRLACGEEHDPEALVRLGPELEVGSLPAPVLAVQVTRPAAGDGGVVLGVSVHHAMADGHSRSSASQGLAPRPTFDRATIQHPEAEELARRFLRTIAPALPTVRSSPCRPTLELDRRRRSFLIRADQIQSVKERIIAQSVAIGEQLEKLPSTYVAVSSLVWTSIVRAKALDHGGDGDGDGPYYFLVPVDCRRRLPDAGEGYFGNCLSLSYAKAAARDLTEPDAGVAHAAGAIRDAAREKLADPLRGAERWAEAYGEMPRERFTPTGSSNRFMAYETDMGWGAPSLVELVSPSGRGMVLLLGAPNSGVQVTVDLDGAHMGHFAANFLQV
ncbi:anthocyanidin 3-O-glucoside 6' [Panicum miliaceum]|uniref:Anthocyanidin 3-O-glucoside 6 n=1 Tax=Panicum miliaceum TaxID=4540 RepID=A0A3L6RT52_PANMI|nr:anthocyanidin 3-O-glucoside 6' [Panicum miliaceum]